MTLDATHESATSETGPRQIYCPRRIKIVTFSGDPAAGGEITFRIEMPDSRIHAKFSIVAIPDDVGLPPAVFMTGRGCDLWPYAVEDDNVNGGPGTPVSNMIAGVTSTAPLPFPPDDGLGGYSREFVTSADAIQVRLRVPEQDGAPAGSLWLQARYQPADFQIVPWDQWAEIRALCGMSIVGGRALVT